MNNTLQLDEFIDIAQFTTEINEDISDLNEAMRTQTARCSYYGMKHAQAKSQQQRIERIVKATEAKLKVEHRRLLTEEAQREAEETDSKPLRITTDMVDAAVYTDNRMLKLGGIKLQADEIETVCKVAYDAFRTRQSMLISLGNLTRDQLRSSLRIHGQDATNSADEYRQRRARREKNAADE